MGSPPWAARASMNALVLRSSGSMLDSVGVAATADVSKFVRRFIARPLYWFTQLSSLACRDSDLALDGHHLRKRFDARPSHCPVNLPNQGKRLRNRPIHA